MRKSQAPPSVVVGIDGSKAAVRAALWAVDEAVSRDIPLRLVYAVDPRTTSRTHPDHAARKLAFADHAIRYALMAVESTEKPVKIEAEIAQARPTTALVRASQSAAMVCVGAVGFKRFEHGHLGSTAAALAHAGLCPVAIVRENDASAGQHAGSIVVETDKSPGNAVLLKIAIEEARLRKAPLLAVTCWQSRYSDDRVVDAVRRPQPLGARTTVSPFGAVEATLPRPSDPLGGRARQHRRLFGHQRPVYPAGRCARRRPRRRRATHRADRQRRTAAHRLLRANRQPPKPVREVRWLPRSHRRIAVPSCRLTSVTVGADDRGQVTGHGLTCWAARFGAITDQTPGGIVRAWLRS
jgi:nucleotide-binding universal stress UspA family protein